MRTREGLQQFLAVDHDLAAALQQRRLEDAPQLLVLNKFGKVECSGGGLRDLIAGAIDRGVPVIIGVPRHNLEARRSFAGEFATE